MALKTISNFGIKGIIPLSMLDWEGRLVSTIFLGGCNFRCPFCHNAQLVTGADDMPDLSWDRIEETLTTKGGWVDGVCITGGEPTISRALPELLREIKGLGLQVKLDTNGTRPNVLQHLIDERLIDAVAMDIKTSFDKYPLATGVNDLSGKVRESIDLLTEGERRGALEVEFRTTVVPTIVEEEDIISIAEYLDTTGAQRYILQQFNQKTVMAEEAGRIKPYSSEVLEVLAKEASRVIEIKVRS